MAKAKKQTEIRWGIIGSLGLYEGQWQWRHSAIREHVDAYRCLGENDAEVWRECRKRGDRCVKLTITYIMPTTKRKAKR